MPSRRSFLLATAASLVLPAAFIRADADPDEGWTRLGKVDLDDQSNKPKAVTASILRGGWQRLKLKVADADAKIDDITITFASGSNLDLKFSDTIKAGQESHPIALKGAGDRPVKKVYIKGHSGQSGVNSIVEVWLSDTK